MDRPRLLLSDHAFMPRGALKGLLGILWAAFLARIPSSLTENCNFFQFLFPLCAMGHGGSWPQIQLRGGQQEVPTLVGDGAGMSMPQVKGQGRSGCRGGGRGLLHALPAEREAKSQGRQRKRVVGPPVQSHWQARPKAPSLPAPGGTACPCGWRGFRWGSQSEGTWLTGAERTASPLQAPRTWGTQSFSKTP